MDANVEMASFLIPTFLEKLPKWFLKIIENKRFNTKCEWTFNILSQIMERQLLIEEVVQSNVPKQFGR